MADFLLAYSTIPGQVSWRCTTTGSFFISTLVKVFSNDARYDDVLNMLIKVNAEVGDLVAKTEEGDEDKQQPEPSFSLRKKLHFYPPKQ